MILLLAAAALPRGLEAGDAGARPGRAWLSLGGGGGVCVPADKAVRTLYGDVSFPLHAHLSLRLAGPFGLIVGYRYLGAAGETAAVGPPVDDEGYDLRLRVHSLRAGIRLDSSLGKASIFALAGGSYNFYKESWLETEISFSGRKAGYFLGAGAEIPVLRFWDIHVRLEYALVPTGKGGGLSSEVDLGGLEAVVGLVFRFGGR